MNRTRRRREWVGQQESRHPHSAVDHEDTYKQDTHHEQRNAMGEQSNHSECAGPCMCLCLCLCFVTVGVGVLWGVMGNTNEGQRNLNDYDRSLLLLFERQEEELTKLGCQTTLVKVPLDGLLATHGIREAKGPVYPPWAAVHRCVENTTYCRPSGTFGDGGPFTDQHRSDSPQVKMCLAAPGAERHKPLLVAFEHSGNMTVLLRMSVLEHTSCLCQ